MFYSLLYDMLNICIKKKKTGYVKNIYFLPQKKQNEKVLFLAKNEYV